MIIINCLKICIFAGMVNKWAVTQIFLWFVSHWY